MIQKIILKVARRMTRVVLLGDWRSQLFCTDSKKYCDDTSRAKGGAESAPCLGNSISLPIN